MAKKYIMVRIPLEAYKNLEKKQDKMQKVVQNIIRKPVNIPMTKVILAVSENPSEIKDDYLMSKIRKRRRR